MKYSEIKEMTDAELQAKIEKLQEEIFQLKCQSRTGELSDSAAVGRMKKDIARIKTEQKARTANATA